MEKFRLIPDKGENYVILEKARPGLVLMQSRKDPRVKRWMRMTPKPVSHEGKVREEVTPEEYTQRMGGAKPVRPSQIKLAKRIAKQTTQKIHGKEALEPLPESKPAPKVKRPLPPGVRRLDFGEEKEGLDFGKEPEQRHHVEHFHSELLGSGINIRYRQEMRKYGYLTILSQTCKDSKELGDLCKIYRNPMFETFRIIAMDGNNKIVGITAISTHLPLETEGFDISEEQKKHWFSGGREEVIDAVKKNLKRVGATKYYLQHNHPGGEVKPSGNADVPLTQLYAEEIPGFQGHIIIDHGKFTVLDSKGAVTYTTEVDEPEKLPTEDDPLKIPFKVHAALGKVITEPADVASIVMKYHLYKEGYYVILTRAGKDGKVTSLGEIPKEYFKDPDSAQKAITGYALMGGGEPFIYGVKLDDPVTKTLIQRRVIRDALNIAGESYYYTFGKESSAPKPFHVFSKQEELMKKAWLEKIRSQQLCMN